jgi:hypothetical protein
MSLSKIKDQIYSNLYQVFSNIFQKTLFVTTVTSWDLAANLFHDSMKLKKPSRAPRVLVGSRAAPERGVVLISEYTSEVQLASPQTLSHMQGK